MDSEEDIHELLFIINGEVEIGYDLRSYIKEKQKQKADLWTIFLQNMN